MKTWEKYIRRVEPYIPGEQPAGSDIIKLNTNENPYPPAPEVIRAGQELPMDRLSRYPDPEASILRKALAKHYGLSQEEIFVGVGSDDVLGMAFLTFFNSEKPILFPNITYSFYEVWAELFGIPYERPELTKDFHICTEDYKRENGGIVLANPNAPTSVFEPLLWIEEIVRANQDSVVIIDEAYIDFGGQSSRELLTRYDNLLVVQTFSKSRSLAGMRIGFGMGSRKLIKAMNDVKYSYNSYTMSQAALLMGEASVRADAYFQETTKRIMETREWLKAELRRLGFSFPDSMTNFLFITHEEIEAEKLFLWLKEQKIYVRYFRKPLLSEYLRVTIGAREDMEVFVAKVGEYMTSQKR
ncbi:MAG: histidinol-phosphate transaminase [Acetivibrio ethanolgignens]